MNAERIRHNLDSGPGAGSPRRPVEPGVPRRRVGLVAVTKKSPAEWIRSLVACGARDLGENYPQELWGKVESTGRPRGFGPLASDWTLADQQGQENAPHGQDDSFCRLAQAVAGPRRCGTCTRRPAGCLPAGQYLGRAEQAWLDSRADHERCRVDRRLPCDPDRRLDDDGRAGDHCRDCARVVRAAPSSCAIS